MKKSKLIQIIRETINQINEQSSGYVKVNARTCTGGMTFGSLCLSAADNPQVGDVYHVPGNQNNPQNRDVFIREILGPCPAHWYTHYGQPYPTSAQNCPRCCLIGNWQSYASNFGGACTLNCGYTTAGSCNPQAWSNYNNWTNSYNNTVNNLIQGGNPNQPCNFLNQKITQFTNQLNNVQGGGGGYANLLQCKLDYTNQLHSQNNC